MTIVVLHPDEATVEDTYIFRGEPTWNYGSVFYMVVGGWSAPDNHPNKGLIRFDLSSIPAGAVIESAVLRLRCNTEQSSTDYSVSVHRSLIQWYEGDTGGGVPGGGENASTWNLRNANGSVAWAGGAGGAAGSDYAVAATDTTLITAPSTTFYTWDVIADVQDWIDGSATNFGWWLIGSTATDSAKTFLTSDTGLPANRPTLTIQFREEMIGDSSGTSTATGTLRGRARLEGSTSGLASVSATLISNQFIRGSASGQATVGGTLSARGSLAGSVTGQATVSGDIKGRVALPSGSAAGEATVSGDIKGRFSIAGSAAGTATATATGKRALILRGLSAGVATVLGTGVVYARSVAHPIVRMPAPLLYLTDGAERFDLLDERVGYALCGWRPAVAQYKGGGQWSDSSLAHGRRLVMRRFANAIEVMELTGSGKDQDELIAYTSGLLQWLESAADYWTSRWATRPVWLVARSAYEEHTRYALVHAGSVPELQDVYSQPFFGRGRAVFDRITLRLERGPWLDMAPGDGSAVAVSSIRSWTVAGWVS